MTVMPVGPPPSTQGARVAAYLHNAGFSGGNLIIAVAVAKAESGWVYDKRGGPNHDGSYDWGLMQINDVHKPTQEQKTKAIPNAKLAHKIFVSNGYSFKPWSSYNNGAYKKYLPEARQAVKDLQSFGPSWERETVKLAGTFDSPVSANPSDIASGISDSLGLSAIGQTLTKIGSNFLAVTLAVALLVLGVVILLRGTVAKNAGGIAGAVVKGVVK